jgi:hypothetical protein
MPVVLTPLKLVRIRGTFTTLCAWSRDEAGGLRTLWEYAALMFNSVSGRAAQVNRLIKQLCNGRAMLYEGQRGRR